MLTILTVSLSISCTVPVLSDPGGVYPFWYRYRGQLIGGIVGGVCVVAGLISWVLISRRRKVAIKKRWWILIGIDAFIIAITWVIAGLAGTMMGVTESIAITGSVVFVIFNSIYIVWARRK